ncbi:MAG TPA: ATP-binding protein [Acetobacteraceae bacterium]|nr:ATP-binding protein [Acetobacteraceae bacterium]
MAVVTAASLIVALNGLRRAVGDDLEKLIALAGPFKEWLELVNHVGLRSFLLAVALLAWLLASRTWIKALEFHLFPWFDDETLQGIGAQTGLLGWVAIRDSPAFDAAARLRAWVTEDVHDGRWPLEWIWRGRPALNRSNVVRFALLLGPNGIGKSQLVREIAKEFTAPRQPVAIHGPTARAKWQARRRWLHATWRRINPLTSRHPEDPWHAGEVLVVGDWAKRIDEWMPAAPTVLILDDPYSAYAGEVIAAIDRNSGRYWYSVRLVVVDQFIPARLCLSKTGDQYRDDHDRPVPVIAIGDIRWTARQFIAATAGGLWLMAADPRHPGTHRVTFEPATEVKEFWNEAQMDRLCQVFDGNPLMLAEAAHWLAKRPFRSINLLLQEDAGKRVELEAFTDPEREAFRRQIVHRILRERIDELLNSHLDLERSERLDRHDFVAAVAAAAIAHGVPLAAFPNAQGMRSLPELRLILPHGDDATIPPPGAWPVSEAYVQAVLANLPQFRLEALVMQAYRANPVGVTRAFTRGGWLASEIVRIIGEAEQGADADPALQCQLFISAAYRALWTSRDAVPQAMRLLDALPAAVLPDALRQVEQVGTIAGNSVPDGVVGLLLVMRLGERRFGTRPDLRSDEWRRFFAMWEAWTRRAGSDLRYVPATILDPLRQGYRNLCQGVFQGSTALNDLHGQFQELCKLYYFGDIRRPLLDEWLVWPLAETHDRPLRGDWTVAFHELFRAAALSRRTEHNPEEAALALDEISRKERIVDELLPDGATPEQAAVVRAAMRVRHAAALVRQRADPATVKEVSGEIDAIVSGFPDSALVQRSHREARAHLARSLNESGADHICIAKHAQSVDAMRARFADDPRIAEEDAWAWAYAVMTSRPEANDREHLDRAAATFGMLDDAFPHDPGVQSALGVGWQNLLEASMPLPDSSERVAATRRRIEAAGIRLAGVADLQWSRANAWATTGEHLVREPKQLTEVEAIARRTDRLAAPWPDHLGLQRARVRAWRTLAAARRWADDRPIRVDEAARRAAWIGRRFLDDALTAAFIAGAWAQCAYAWAGRVGEVRMAEDAARRVDAIADLHRRDEAFQICRAFAWNQVSFARWRRVEDQPLVEEIARMVAGIAALFPASDELKKHTAIAWQLVAFARSEAHEPYAQIAEAVGKVRQAASQYPDDPEMTSVLKAAESCLSPTAIAGAGSPSPQQSGRALVFSQQAAGSTDAPGRGAGSAATS